MDNKSKIFELEHTARAEDRAATIGYFIGGIASAEIVHSVDGTMPRICAGIGLLAILCLSRDAREKAIKARQEQTETLMYGPNKQDIEDGLALETSIAGVDRLKRRFSYADQFEYKNGMAGLYVHSPDPKPREEPDHTANFRIAGDLRVVD